MIESSPGVSPNPGKSRPAGKNAPLIALQKPEACAALGLSPDSFERYVQPYVRVIRLGRMRLYPVKELERWVSENAEGL